MIEKDISFRREELEKLSTLELEHILRTELDSDTPQRENILLLLSILEERDPTDSMNRPEGTMEAWNAIANHNDKSEHLRVKPSRKSRKRFVSLAAAAAIVLILLMTVPQTVGAENIFEILGRWTRNLFSFSDETKNQKNGNYVFQTDNEGLQQIYEAVVEQGITDPVVPSWIPEGYELKELQVLSPNENTKVYSRFVKGDCYIQLVIEIHSMESTNKYTKDEIDAGMYNSMDAYYYIVSNEDTWKAVWSDEMVECSLVTNDAKEVLYKLLKSINRRNNK